MSLSESGADRCIGEAVLSNAKGLHLRASNMMVRCAQQHDAETTIICRGRRISGTSILELLELAAGPGTPLTIETEGPDAEIALDAILALIEGKFGEAE